MVLTTSFSYLEITTVIPGKEGDDFLEFSPQSQAINYNK